MPSKQQILKADILIRRISIAVYSITPEKVLIFAAEIDKITPFTTKHECFVPSKEMYDTITNFIVIYFS